MTDCTLQQQISRFIATEEVFNELFRTHFPSLEEITKKKYLFIIKKYKKGEQIIYEKDAVLSFIYFIVAGGVYMKMYAGYSKEIIVSLRTPGDIIGEKSKGLHSLSALAKEDCVILIASRRDVWNFPGFSSFLLGKIEEYNEQSIRRLYIISLKSATQRVAIELLFLSETIGYKIVITHSELANMCNLTREAVTRSIDNLVKKGVVLQQRNKTIIINPGLKAEVEKLEGLD